MNRIYVGHARNSNYREDLYEPMRLLQGYDHLEFIFSHEDEGDDFVSERDLKRVALFIAEISYPATGLGIELGFAHLYNVPILCLYKEGSKPSASIRRLRCKIFEYSDTQEMLGIIKKELKTIISI